MGIDDTLRGLIDGAYAAALDDSQWLPWSEKLIETLGGVGGTFIVIDPKTMIMDSAHYLRIDPNISKTYLAEEMWRIDPQIPYACNLQQTGIYTDTDHVDSNDKAAAAHAAFLRGNGRLDHYMTALSRLDGGRRHVGLSIHRRLGTDVTPDEEQRKLAAMMPEIARAMELGFVQSAKLADAYWDGASAARSEPALLIDQIGRVIRISDSMIAMLAANCALTVRGDRLCASSHADDDRIQSLIGRATAAQDARSGAIRIGRSPALKPLVVTAFALPRRSRTLAPAEAAALVTVVDPAASPGGGNGFYRDAFALTARESEVAVLLMAGHSIESAATALTIALPTARVHLRHILAKTETSRQSDLIRLLSRLN